MSLLASNVGPSAAFRSARCWPSFQHRHRLLGDLRGAHPGHGVGGDLVLLLQPPEELLEGPVPHPGRGGRLTAQRVLQVRLHVLPAHVIDRSALGRKAMNCRAASW